MTCASRKIVREIVPVAKARTTGLIAEVAPDRLLGLTSDRERADGSILYGVDVATGEVLFTQAPAIARHDRRALASLGFDPKDASRPCRGQDRTGGPPDVRRQ